VTAQLSPLRSGRITGSRVGAILGLCRDKSLADVMRELVRDHFGDPVEFLGNEHTERGKALEEPARTAYEQLTGKLVLDAQDFVIHPAHDFLGYSPDGLVDDDGLVEFKAPTRWARWHGIDSRPDFYAQIQLGLACTGRSWAHFCEYRPGDPLEPELVKADPAWLDANLPALQAFHAEFERIIADPKAAAKYRNDLVALLDDPDSALDEAELAQVLTAKEELEQREQQIRDRLIERAKTLGAKTARGRWFQITQVNGRRTVRYKDAIAELAPGADLSRFTDAAGEPSFRISRMKDAE